MKITTKHFITTSCALLLSFYSTALVQAQNLTNHFPPSALLTYKIDAISDLPIAGEATIDWTINPPDTSNATSLTYHITSKTHALGTEVISAKSEGLIETPGILPVFYKETTRNPLKPQEAAKTNEIIFHHTNGTITFQNGQTAKFTDKEQDRLSVIWQLIRIAREATLQKFIPQSTWSIPVAQNDSVENFVFTVEDNQTLNINGVSYDTVRVIRTSADGNRRITAWLAPEYEWYPVKLSLKDKNIVIDQTIKTITPHRPKK